MVTVEDYSAVNNSLNTDTTDSGPYTPDGRNTAESLLDQRVNQFTQLLRQRLNFRVPTPPQSDENEVDNGDRTDNRVGAEADAHRPSEEETESSEDERPQFPNYALYEVRLQSFENWPNRYIQPSDLAAAGFYYTGENDSVHCFECHIELSQWEENEDPMVLHRRWSGNCSFIPRLPCGHTLIDAESDTISVSQLCTRDSCGPARSEENAESSGEERPKFPEYESYEKRLESFGDWPIALAQTKEQLAEAGFYYLGIGDMTGCYQCGVKLKSWETQDEPWSQHAKWMPKCPYVRLTKGQEFIDNVVEKEAIPPLEEDVAKMTLNNVETVEPSVRQISESVEESNTHSLLTEDVAGSNSTEEASPVSKQNSTTEP